MDNDQVINLQERNCPLSHYILVLDNSRPFVADIGGDAEDSSCGLFLLKRDTFPHSQTGGWNRNLERAYAKK